MSARDAGPSSRGAAGCRVGAPQAAARRGAGGLRRQRLPRRRDGRHRRAGRGVQAGAVPALPGQARAVPRAARHPGRGAVGRRARRAGRHRRQPRARPRRAERPTSSSSTATTSDGAFRLIFETDLGNEPAVRERVEAVTAEDDAGRRRHRRRRHRPRPRRGRAAGHRADRRRAGRGPLVAGQRQAGLPATTRSGCSSRCCGAASRTSRATGNRAIRPASALDRSLTAHPRRPAPSARRVTVDATNSNVKEARWRSRSAYCTRRGRSSWTAHRPRRRSRRWLPTALKSVDGQLSLTDERGRRVIVPANLVAYVEIAQADVRRVGFGSTTPAASPAPAS